MATVTGLIQDAAGNIATSGNVQFKLAPWSPAILYRVGGLTLIAPTIATCGIDATGHIKNLTLTGVCRVWGNDNITPANTCYSVVEAPGGTIDRTIDGVQITGTGGDLASPTFCPRVRITPEIAAVTTAPSNANVIPGTDNFYVVGGPQNRYANGYFNNLNVTGTCTGCGGGGGGGGTPGGTPGQPQVNIAGSFAGMNGTYYDNANATTLMQGNLYIGYDSSYNPSTWNLLNPQIEIHASAAHPGSLLDGYSSDNRTVFSILPSDFLTGTAGTAGATYHSMILLGSADVRPVAPSSPLGTFLWGDVVSPGSGIEENISVYNRNADNNKTWKNVLLEGRAGLLRGKTNMVAFSATPNFDLNLGNLQKITLTGNVTSSTLSNVLAGQEVAFIITQDAVGARTFAWPANVIGATAISSGANAVTTENFISDGVNLRAMATGGGGGSAPGGSPTSMQYNNGGVLGGFGTYVSGTSTTTFPGPIVSTGAAAANGTFELGQATATLGSNQWCHSGSLASNAAPCWMKFSGSPADAFDSFIFPCSSAGNLCKSAAQPGADSADIIPALSNIQIQQGISGTDTVGSDAYALTVTPAILAYADNMRFCFQAGTANTGNATLKVSGLAAWNILKRFNAALDDNDILAGMKVCVVADVANTAWQMQTPVANSSAGAVSSVFTRTGAVTATSGDYTAAQVTNAFDKTAANTLTNVAAPGSPSAGSNAVFSDSTDLRFHDKNASGVIGTTVVADTGAANNFVTAISAAGVISKAQVGFGNLSGSLASSQDYARTIWIPYQSTSASACSANAVANQVRWHGVYLPFALTATNFIVRVVTTDTGSNTYDIGLYNSSGNLAAHTGGIAGASVLNSAATVVIAITGGPISLPPGKYYWAMVSSSATGNAVLSSVGSNVPSFYGTQAAGTSGSAGILPGTESIPADSWSFSGGTTTGCAFAIN